MYGGAPGKHRWDNPSLKPAFLVIATQNPVEQQGTFPLPEAQLDRFLFKVKMGYPSTTEGIDIMKRFMADNPLDQLDAVAGVEEIEEAQRLYTSVAVSEDLLIYMLSIVEATRSHPDAALGASPRSSQALLRACQAYAALRGRDYVMPDDVKAISHSCSGAPRNVKKCTADA